MNVITKFNSIDNQQIKRKLLAYTNNKKCYFRDSWLYECNCFLISVLIFALVERSNSQPVINRKRYAEINTGK